MKSKVPEAIVEPLRRALRADANVVRAWWKDGSLLIALDDVSGDTEDYRAHLQDLSAAVLPLFGQFGASLACGPLNEITPAARGAVLLYERGEP